MTPLRRAQLLRHRYLLSLEGNDVASNLKWLMGHNSVVVMPPPTVETWLLEGLLRCGPAPISRTDVPSSSSWVAVLMCGPARFVFARRPWVHYVPVRRDARDVPAVLAWMRTHEEACLQIVANANAWVEEIMRGSGEAVVRVVRQARLEGSGAEEGAGSALTDESTARCALSPQF